MKRRRFVAAVTATTVGIAGCSSPREDEGEGEGEGGGGGPYGKVGDRPRSVAP